jgi:hypothetical protein
MANDNIAALLANAADTKANFDFGSLNKSYWAGLDEVYKRRNQDAFLNIQNDPSLQDASGNPDPTKLFMRQLQVGGTSAAKSADELGVGADRLGGYRAADELERRLRGTSPQPQNNYGPPSLNRSVTPAPTSRPGPTSYADPTDDGSAGAVTPARPQAAAGPFTQFLTAQGVPPEQQGQEAVKLQQGFMQLTGRPFDMSKGLNLADNDTRQVLGKYVLSRAAQGQQPQAGTATQVGPQGVVAGPGQAQTAPAAIQQQFPMSPAPGPQTMTAPGPQTMMLSPEAGNAMAQAQPQQSGLIDPESLRQMVPANILRAGGGTVAGTLNFLSEIVNSRIPADRKAGYVKLYDDLTKQLQLNDAQRNALSSGQPNPLAYDINKANTTELGKQDIDTFNKRNIPIQAAAQMSYDGIQKAKLMKQLTMDPNFYSGPLSKNVQTYNQFKSIFGQDPSSALPQEAFNKVANDMLTEQIKAMGGSGVGRVLLSEVNNMKASLAGLGITPQTNRALAEIVQRTYTKNQHIADIANSVPQTPGKINRTFDTQVQNYLQKNPMFTPEELKMPALLGAPDTPPGSERWSPAQARQWAATVGLKPGDPIRVDGKIRAIP